MVQVVALLATLAFSLGFVRGAAPTCGAGNLCPSSAPCCSAYGECGVGAYCLGGCDPLFSHSLKSCVARPSCKSADYKLDSLNDIQQNTIYLGDASSTNWVAEGTPVVYDGNSILLTMAPDTVGTLLSSTHYVWYGKISATLKTSAGPGVVTAFIMMSDVKDEIDFEFVGAYRDYAQSNYYYQGITNYTNELNVSASSTNSVNHTYTIDWQPDSIAWSVDGQVLRTVEKAGTWNATTGDYMFPQTPSRIMLSLWPAGLAKNGQGTVEWAGGLIDWNSQYMQNGYYYAQVSDVTVHCYDPPTDANITGSKSYVYNGNAGTNNTVATTDDQGILASFYATGENEGYNPYSPNSPASASGTGQAHSSATSTVSMPTNTDVQTVPGVVGAGNRGETSAGGIDGTTFSGGNLGGAFGLLGQPGSGVSGSGSTGGSFVQGNTAVSERKGTNKAVNGKNEKAMRGSAFAVLIAFIGLIALSG